MKLMKLAGISATMMVAFLGTASASPVCVSGGSLASYQALLSGGCTIGNELFSNFVYGGTAGGTGVIVDPANIVLTPVNGNSFVPGPGIVFSSSGWKVPGASLTFSYVDSSISFTVTALDGTSPIGDAGLTLTSFTQSGTGVIRLSETVNPIGQSMQATAGSPSAHMVFPPVSSVSVLKDLFIYVPASDASGSGSAQLNSFQEDFSLAPEPLPPVLVGCGLMALGLFRRRAARHN